MEGNDGSPKRVIVIGCSAGGLPALKSMLFDARFDGLPAAVFVVQHVHMNAMSLLPQILARLTDLNTKHAAGNEEVAAGTLYVAPPDSHMVLEDGHVCLHKGPRANSVRPSIDVLFQSAGRAYGPSVIGVILSGFLDDGTLGLVSIKRRGGITIVQDPLDAEVPEMPRNAIEHVEPHYVLPSKEIGELLVRLVKEPIREVAMKEEETPKELTGFTCPECGGSLRVNLTNGNEAYDCHTGHKYSLDSLMAAQADAAERGLWTALRLLKERSAMFERAAASMKLEDDGRRINVLAERQREMDENIQAISKMLMG